MEKNFIKIKNLNKFYGKKQALCNVNLTIEQGMFGLLGRNGAGKTTLMKTLATLLNKKSGDVTVCGIPIENAREIRRIIGYLPQDFSMYPGMTVYEAMDYLGVLSQLNTATRKKRIPMLLEKVNLSSSSKAKVKALSGGMRRRLGIAQAILHEPQVLIVDEPTAGLDPEERIRFRNLLCDIANDRIVLLSTHIVGDIEATCEKIAILDEGKLLFNGLTSQLIGTAEGKIFNISISPKELPYLKERYLITSMITKADKVTVRFIADENPPGTAIQQKPTIEDAYMLCMHASGVEKHEIGNGI
jgi:ABC-type multidrug transport system, ATPase component